VYTEGVDLCEGEGVDLCEGEGVDLYEGEGVDLSVGEGGSVYTEGIYMSEGEMRSQVKLRPGVATRLLAEMRIWFSEGRV
jgi:hypothetical protein